MLGQGRLVSTRRTYSDPNTTNANKNITIRRNNQSFTNSSIFALINSYFKMAKQSSVVSDNGRRDESRDIATLRKFSHLLHLAQDIYSESWRRRQIQPPQIRRREQVYDPLMVSIGTYHHSKPELRREFKLLCLDWRAGGYEKKMAFFYSKILEKLRRPRQLC